MRVLVLGAGGPAGVNWCRALSKAGHWVYATDENEAHLAWCKPYAYPTDPYSVKAEVVHALPDQLVLWLAEHREDFSAVALLPSVDTIRRCQHKPDSIQTWERARLRSGATSIGAEIPDWMHLAKARYGMPFWLRATRGAGARGAALVEDLRTGYHWIRYWQTRNVALEWIAEEYFPGRDYAWTGIYQAGDLVSSFARERLEYIYPNLSPSGLTGTPTIARAVHDDRVNEMAERAVSAVDANPNGLYAVDLREDREGIPRPTEINPGRGGTTTGLWSLYDVNFAEIHVRLAAGWPVDVPKRDALPDGLELRRHIDCGHVFVQT